MELLLVFFPSGMIVQICTRCGGKAIRLGSIFRRFVIILPLP
jgi:hypothetical protein